MAFWRRGRDAAITGFWAGIGAGVGNAIASGVGRIFGRPTFTSKETNAVAAELLQDFQAMPESELANLRRRYRDALQHNQGDRFVALLSRIPPDPEAGRQKMLKYLNDLPDEQFEEMMHFLEHPRSVSDKLAKHVGALADYLEGSKGGEGRG